MMMTKTRKTLRMHRLMPNPSIQSGRYRAADLRRRGQVYIPPRPAIRYSSLALIGVGSVAAATFLTYKVLHSGWVALACGWIAAVLLIVCFYAAFILAGELLSIKFSMLKYGWERPLLARIFNPEVIALAIASPLLLTAFSIAKGLV